MMKAIDIHTHCNCGRKGDVAETELHKRGFDFFMEEYRNSGIICGGFSYYAGLFYPDEAYACNEQLYEQAQNDARVYQWLILDPRVDILFGQIEKLITNEKVLGIKIHNHKLFHNYSMDEYADKIFSFANELGCNVMMHPDDNLKMMRYVDQYPNMNLILAHLSSVEHVEAMRRAKHGNIYTDTSGSMINRNDVVEYAVEQLGSEKIFFGTDTYACGCQKGRIEYARISDRDKENILYNNAKRHFAKQFAKI